MLPYSLALARMPGISLSMAMEAVRQYGSAKAVFDNASQLPHRAAKAMELHASESLEWAQAEQERAAQRGIELLQYDEESYPLRLKECSDAPLALFYRGEDCINARRMISVVGTRNITEPGKDLCAAFVTELGKMFPDTVIVSGLAYGVDIHAHRAALSCGMRTIAVLAHGLDRVYPPTHRDTAEAMCRQGGLLTEYPFGTRPDKGNFVRRNRIVAGMTDATVVVESADKGGALITARLAADYNREVMAFPGRPSDRFSQGCNDLIKNQEANLVTCAADVARILGWRESPAKKADEGVQRELFPELTPLQSRICEVLRGSDGLLIDRLAILTNEPVNAVSAELFELELMGMVRPVPGGKYKLV